MIPNETSKILVIGYSQTGQLQRAARSFVRHLNLEPQNAVWLPIESMEIFPFPWTFWSFFGVFHRTFSGKCAPLTRRFSEQLRNEIPDSKLVVFAVQPWFLCPSLPAQSFLESPEAQLLSGKPVIILCVCRKMWSVTCDIVEKRLKKLGAVVVGVLPVGMETGAYLSHLTTPIWMLSGKQKPIKVLPAAGLAEDQFEQLEELGKRISLCLEKDSLLSENIFLDIKKSYENQKYVMAERVLRHGFRFYSWAQNGVVRLELLNLGKIFFPLLILLHVLYIATSILFAVPIFLLFSFLSNSISKMFSIKVRIFKLRKG